MSTTDNNTRTATPSAAVTATEIVMPGLVEPAGLHVRSRQLEAPSPAQALVRVEASGVSFAEQSMRRGRYPGAPRVPFVPGYDLVGTVHRVGADVDPALVGRRVAALTKSGGWASHALLDATDLVVVPDGVDPAEAETLVVNGITAWQMLHRQARVRPGQTILVHGANGGVGTTLVQLAPKGTLVSYAISSTIQTTESIPVAFARLLSRLAWWNALPNGRRAGFYNVWSGHRLRPAAFRARLDHDLTTVFGLLADGVLTAHVAARLPLTQAREAMELAESHTVYGKVILIP